MNVPDTVGVTEPFAMYELVDKVYKVVNTHISIHWHTILDLRLRTAWLRKNSDGRKGMQALFLLLHSETLPRCKFRRNTGERLAAISELNLASSLVTVW